MPPKGQKLSEEAWQKIRESRLGKSSWNKGIPFSEESKEKMRKAKLGKKKSPEFKQRRAEIMKEKWKDPVFREEMRQKKLGANNPNYGKPMSDERKQRQREFALSRTDGHMEKCGR